MGMGMGMGMGIGGCWDRMELVYSLVLESKEGKADE